MGREAFFGVLTSTTGSSSSVSLPLPSAFRLVSESEESSLRNLYEDAMFYQQHVLY